MRAFKEEVGAELREKATEDEADGAQEPAALAEGKRDGQNGGSKDRRNEDQNAASKGAVLRSVRCFWCCTAVGGNNRG